MSVNKKTQNRNCRTRRAKPEQTKKRPTGVKSDTTVSRNKVEQFPAAGSGRKLPLRISSTLQGAGARPSSKLEIVISMLRQRGGVTLAALSKATGWQAHSVRGALSGAISKKRGLKVLSEKTGTGPRTYRIAG